MPTPQTTQTTDPGQNPLAYVVQHKDALEKMKPEKGLKFVDFLFRKYMIPRYQAANPQFPLKDEELNRLRLQFAAKMLNIPIDPTTKLDDIKPSPTMLEKAGAAVEGAGAGVLGGLRTIADLDTAINKHLGKIGAPSAKASQTASNILGRTEGKAYEDAQAVSPKVASASAAVGHQIPAAIASEGVGSLFSGAVGPATTTAGRVLSGGVKGALEGGTYGATTPGGKPLETAEAGGVLGALFPLLGSLFKRGATAKAVESGAAKVEEGAKAASPKPTLESLKAEIEQQRAAKTAERAAKKAKLEAKKAPKTPSEQAADRSKEAAKAQGVAQAQAEVRSSQPPPTPAEIHAKQTPAERVLNPQPVVETPKTAAAKAQATAAAQENPQIKVSTNTPTKVTETPKVEPTVTKVPEGQAGKKIRAKAGKPASPAQQKADAERVAAKRDLAKKEEFGAALEKHAQQMAGRYVGKTVGIEALPEIEEAVKEMPGGNVILKELQKYRRAHGDEIYVESMKEWLMNQLEAKQ